LDDPHRQTAPLLHGGEVRGRHIAGFERPGQDIGRRDRILHGEIDADAADRRHRMRGIADAE